MARLRSEHGWAAHLIAANLSGAFVHPVGDDDDGSRSHDLDVERDGRIRGAVVVTAATDEESAQLWTMISSRDETWTDSSVAGGWMVVLLPSARAGVVRPRLPALLGLLEQYGVTELSVGEGMEGVGAPEARRIGVASARRHDAAISGSILLTVQPRASSAADAPDADVLPAWVGAWLREPEQAADLAALERSGAEERHLFVVVPGLTTAPADVVTLLLRDDPPLPRAEPDLPGVVTRLWLASTWASGAGLRWMAETGWQPFHKL